MQLRGKVALVTGAAQGLGKGFSEAMLNRGAKVALVDMNESMGRETEKELSVKYGYDNVVFLRCDVTNKDQLESVFRRTVEEFGTLDIVVNNAGVSKRSHWELILEVNLMETGPVYSAAKHGVVGLSRSLGLGPHLLQRGVRVCALCPTQTDTDIHPARLQRDPEMQKMADEHWRLVDSEGGLIKISQVVDGFLQLVEDDSKNGAVMRVTLQRGVDYQPYGRGGEGVPYTRRAARSKLRNTEQVSDFFIPAWKMFRS
ncbi:HPGD [Branchiostoma lanceolatum]|uniref:15-hydroxyprostaglandin dehydrogenase [NAD(+)] n=1 Tax=Branchiostoma lanceolatum TaxID=7740 RepID=A0A8K0A675_BRALA|nr:HPGD [Branchiostoma lanceolatum]